MKRIGRPMKYKHIIEQLEDDKVYSPALIAREAITAGILERGDRQKARHTLSRLSNNHAFPAEGDGLVRIPGQTATIGWHGKRWKAAVS